MSFIKKYKMPIIYTVITLLAGGLSALLSGSFDIYTTMKQPPLAPPAIVFPIMWTVLYILMGISAGIVADSHDLDRTLGLKLYFLQLALNILWPVIFFRFTAVKFALFWLVLIIIAVIALYREFNRISKTAGRLLIPYILWLIFAFYLNFGFIIFNS